jgi:hypothetical protein
MLFLVPLLSSQGAVLYDVTFEPPEHRAGQSPSVGGISAPSGIGGDLPIVRSSLGDLILFHFQDETNCVKVRACPDLVESTQHGWLKPKK